MISTVKERISKNSFMFDKEVVKFFIAIPTNNLKEYGLGLWNLKT